MDKESRFLAFIMNKGIVTVPQMQIELSMKYKEIRQLVTEAENANILIPLDDLSYAFSDTSLKFKVDLEASDLYILALKESIKQNDFTIVFLQKTLNVSFEEVKKIRYWMLSKGYVTKQPPFQVRISYLEYLLLYSKDLNSKKIIEQNDLTARRNALEARRLRLQALMNQKEKSLISDKLNNCPLDIAKNYFALNPSMTQIEAIQDLKNNYIKKNEDFQKLYDLVKNATEIEFKEIIKFVLSS